MAIVIRSVDNNNTTVGHFPREFSHLLWHGGEIECEMTGRRQRSPLVQGRFEIPCNVALHGKKLVARVRDVTAGEIKLSRTCPFGRLNLPLSSIRSSDHALFPQLRKQVVISGLIFVSVDVFQAEALV